MIGQSEHGVQFRTFRRDGYWWWKTMQGASAQADHGPYASGEEAERNARLLLRDVHPSSQAAE